MFAVYCKTPNSDDPLAALIIGNRPEPEIQQGWVRVKVTHASLNRHDIFTLRGITAHKEGINFPMILGNDAVGTLDDGTGYRPVNLKLNLCKRGLNHGKSIS